MADLSSITIDRIRAAYWAKAPLKEIAAKYGLTRSGMAALSRQFRAEAEALKTSAINSAMQRVVVRRRILDAESGNESYRMETLPRISMHLAYLKEAGHVVD